MLDQLHNLVKEHAVPLVAGQNDIPSDKKDAAVSVVSDSLMDSIKSQVSSGKLFELTSLFSGKTSPESSSLMNVFGKDLSANLVFKRGRLTA